MHRYFLMSVFTRFCFVFLVAVPAQAQEVWLEPNRFRLKDGEPASIGVMMGDGFPGDAVNMNKINVASVHWYTAGGQREIPVSGQSLINIKIGSGGTHVATVEARQTSRTWSGAEFKTYLNDNGQEAISDARESAHVAGNSARETCTWYAKLIVQSGATPDQTFGVKAGLRVEIVPETNPYTIRTGDHLRCLVLIDGRPAPHVLVKVWSRLNITTFLQNIYTEDDGRITFPISTKGLWMVTTMKVVHGENDDEWESYHGSLVFGI